MFESVMEIIEVITFMLAERLEWVQYVIATYLSYM
jgi:hypothetical protein